MNNNNSIKELIDYSRLLFERKLIHASGGNTSVRDGDTVWISQTGAELGALTPELVVQVDLNGTVIHGSRPSKEMGMHLAMYRARPDTRAVIHAHPTFSIAHSTRIDSATHDAVPPYTAAFYVRAGLVPLVPYHPSGARSLHQAVVQLATHYHALLLRQHGLLVAGRSMADALGVVEEIEQCCHIALLTGETGEALSADQCRAIDGSLGRSWPSE